MTKNNIKARSSTTQPATELQPQQNANPIYALLQSGFSPTPATTFDTNTINTSEFVGAPITLR